MPRNPYPEERLAHLSAVFAAADAIRVAFLCLTASVLPVSTAFTVLAAALRHGESTTRAYRSYLTRRAAIDRHDIPESDIRSTTGNVVTLWNGRRIVLTDA